MSGPQVHAKYVVVILSLVLLAAAWTSVELGEVKLNPLLAPGGGLIGDQGGSGSDPPASTFPLSLGWFGKALRPRAQQQEVGTGYGNCTQVTPDSFLLALLKLQMRMIQAWEAGRIFPFELSGPGFGNATLRVPRGMLERMSRGAAREGEEGAVRRGAASLKQLFLATLLKSFSLPGKGRQVKIGGNKPLGIHTVALGGSVTRGFWSRADRVPLPWPSLIAPFFSTAFPSLHNPVSNSAVRACGSICPALSLPVFLGQSPGLVITEFNINVGEDFDDRLLLHQLTTLSSSSSNSSNTTIPSLPALLNLDLFGCRELFAGSAPSRGGASCDPLPTPTVTSFSRQAASSAFQVSTLSFASALRPFWRPPSQPPCPRGEWEALSSGQCEIGCTLPVGRCPNTANMHYSRNCSACLAKCYMNSVVGRSTKQDEKGKGRKLGEKQTKEGQVAAGGAEAASWQLSACRASGAGLDVSVDSLFGPDRIHMLQLGHHLTAAMILRHLLDVLLQITEGEAAAFLKDFGSLKQQEVQQGAEGFVEGHGGSSKAVGRECFTTKWGQYRSTLRCRPLAVAGNSKVSAFPGWTLKSLSADKELFWSGTAGSRINFTVPCAHNGWLALLFLKSARSGPARISVKGDSGGSVDVNSRAWTSDTSVVGGFVFPRRIQKPQVEFELEVLGSANKSANTTAVGFGLVGAAILPSSLEVNDGAFS